MRKITAYFLLGFVVMLVFTYVMGLYDDAFKRSYYTGVWYKDIPASLKYYVLWVLPYWWLAILVGTIILGFLLYVIHLGIEKLK
ncbi:hypothetical protein ACL9RF_13665 [Sphingobacterium sp. Mn56C]|uniref:hypothetical protein n=1 Tax=Sphingobacterium sp. Mn56C TaxID=3395261 RepID=UPI003BE79F9E